MSSAGSLVSSMNTNTRRGKISFVLDERLSRDRMKSITRIAAALRPFADVDVLPGTTTEEDAIKKTQEQQYSLLLAPWYRYAEWKRVDALFGQNRSQGPTFAGYFADSLKLKDLKEPPPYFRSILLDFYQATTEESALLVRSLAFDELRSGVRPLLKPDTPVYADLWSAQASLGSKVDVVLSLPELQNTDWLKRSMAIQICMNALWSMVTQGSQKAIFQVGVDPQCLVLRVCTEISGFSTPKELVKGFWKNGEAGAHPVQVIQQFSDFFRVHPIADTRDVEITIGFLASAPSEKTPHEFHTLWIEPIARDLVIENPMTMKQSPWIRMLPSTPVIPARATTDPNADRKDKFLFEAAQKIKEMRKELAEKDETILELKSGGIGTAAPAAAFAAPPEAEELLETLQERFLDLEHEIATIPPDSPQAARIPKLQERQSAWIRKLGQIVEQFREARKKRVA